MKNMKKFIYCVIVLVPLQSLAQAPTRHINDLAFLSGTWATRSEWGDMEQHWSAPMGNSLMCVYRCVKDGRVIFYELMLIEQTAEGPVMYLRHFSPGSVAWEEKDKPWEYPLMFLEHGHARFERKDRKTALTFRRTGPETLRVILERQDEEGRWVEDVFDYRLTAPKPVARDSLQR